MKTYQVIEKGTLKVVYQFSAKNKSEATNFVKNYLGYSLTDYKIVIVINKNINFAD